MRVHETERSRSPLARMTDYGFYEHDCKSTVSVRLETIDEDECSVGCAETPEQNLRGKISQYDVSKLKTGCFEPRIFSNSTEVPRRESDHTVFFQQARNTGSEVIEIFMEISPEMFINTNETESKNGS